MAIAMAAKPPDPGGGNFVRTSSPSSTPSLHIGKTSAWAEGISGTTLPPNHRRHQLDLSQHLAADQTLKYDKPKLSRHQTHQPVQRPSRRVNF